MSNRNPETMKNERQYLPMDAALVEPREKVPYAVLQIRVVRLTCDLMVAGLRLAQMGMRVAGLQLREMTLTDLVQQQAAKITQLEERNQELTRALRDHADRWAGDRAVMHGLEVKVTQLEAEKAALLKGLHRECAAG